MKPGPKAKLRDDGRYYRCPVCESLLNGFQAVTAPDDKLGPGDVTVCAYCFTVLKVTAARQVYRAMPAAEVEALPSKVLSLIERTKEYIRRHPPPP